MTRNSAAVTARSRIKRAPTDEAAALNADRIQLQLHTLQAFRTIFGSARAYDAAVRRVAGISGSQLWALSEIARSGGINVNALSERMAVHQTTASNLINALVQRGLIRRLRDGTDQRVVRLHIAAAGKRVLLRAPRPYAGLLVDALGHLQPGQMVQLHHSLAVLIGVLRRTATLAAGEPILGE